MLIHANSIQEPSILILIPIPTTSRNSTFFTPNGSWSWILDDCMTYRLNNYQQDYRDCFLISEKLV
jgi:hypothetical protein